MQNCTIDCIELIGNFSQSATCDFVQNNCIQDTVQFIQTYYCYFDSSFTLLIIISIVCLVIIYYGLQILTDDHLAPCVEEFIHQWKVSDVLAGITFLAFANGAPDIITAIVAGSSSSTTTALIPFGSLYGAALFGMGFILGKVIIFSQNQKLHLKKREVLLPLGFYILGTLFLIAISVFYSKMNLLISLSFLSLYGIYIGIVLYDEKKKYNKKKQQSLLEQAVEQKTEEEQLEKQMDQIFKLFLEQRKSQEQRPDKNTLQQFMFYIQKAWRVVLYFAVPPYSSKQWQPLKAICSLMIAPFVCAASYGFLSSFQNTLFSCYYIIWFSIPAVCLLLHSLICIYKKIPPQNTLLYSLYSFIIVVCWITLVCSILINLMQLLQLLTNINSVFLGLTVLAWANSIGDYLSITAFAKKGYASTAVAGIFSGQLANFLLGFGISCVINSIDGEYKFIMFDFAEGTFDVLSDSIVLGVIGMAVLYMVWVGIKVVQQKGELSRRESRVSLYYYAIFIILALGLSISTDFFKSLSCDL